MTAASTNNNTGVIPAETTGEKLGAFLQVHSEIEFILPSLVGMMITNRLKLRGAMALLVNLTVAGLVREAIEILKHQATAPATVETASNSAATYTLIHSVPGRIRLRMPRLASDRDYAKRLESLLNADDYVIGARINRSAASIAIRYQVGVLSDWELGMRLTNIVNQADYNEWQSPEVVETTATEPTEETTDTDSSEED